MFFPSCVSGISTLIGVKPILSFVITLMTTAPWGFESIV